MYLYLRKIITYVDVMDCFNLVNILLFKIQVYLVKLCVVHIVKLINVLMTPFVGKKREHRNVFC